MRLTSLSSLLVIGLAQAASWGFEGATLQVNEARGSEAGQKKPFSPEKPLTDSILLKPSGFLRLALTVTNGGKPRRAHQAFVTIANTKSGLEESFPMTINDDGKAKLDIKYTDIPTALTTSSAPLKASIVIGSFGSSKALKSPAFTFTAATNPAAKSAPAAPRYTAQPEIHHIFKDAAKSSPKILTLVFTLAVVACFPVLLGAWAGLGANLKHLPKAFGSAPVSHALFFGSIVGMEFVFWQYYTYWRLFTVLPVAGVVSVVLFMSGSGALTEVQERRLNGER